MIRYSKKIVRLFSAGWVISTLTLAACSTESTESQQGVGKGTDAVSDSVDQDGAVLDTTNLDESDRTLTDTVSTVGPPDQSADPTQGGGSPGSGTPTGGGNSGNGQTQSDTTNGGN